MKVQTTIGEIDNTLLEIRDVAAWGDNARVLATEWYHKGELVRRDVWVNVLKAAEVGVKRGQ